MFKKLKDRIAEEVKQSPRIQASVQQLSQYSLFNEGSNQDLTPDGSKTDLFLPFSSSPITSPSDNSPFSIGEDDELDQSAVTKSGAPFEVVDLGQAATSSSPIVEIRTGGGRHSRTNSMGSVPGDSSIFPTYQSSYSSFQLPSDLESNASEIDEAATMHRDKYSQEQVFQAYQRIRTRYQKYKGRYADTARAYQELERENDKMKTVLAETQDKALRRMNELKEQCQLEQKAKAHLEETLRADIEEKDHKILTLNTKVEILKSNGDSAFHELKGGEEIVIRKKDEETNTDEIESEEWLGNAKVKAEFEEKINRLEALLLKSKDIIKTNKAKVLQLSEEGESLRTQIESEKKSSEELKNRQMEELQVLQNDLMAAREEIKALRQQEEQNALAMAQTKQTMHKELEEKELKNLNLTESVSKLTLENESLQKQMKKVNEDLEHQQSTNEEDKKNALHELSRGKAAALQLLKHEMEEKMKEKEQVWQQNYTKKVKELEQKADDDVHKKMSEFKNQHQMELDEKELQKMAALSEAEKNIQDRDQTIEALTRQKLELEEQLSQHEDSHSAACKSWEMREAELDEKQQEQIQELKRKHEEEFEEINKNHLEEMESHAMQFKEKYIKRLAELRSEHEEALLGASSQQEEEYRKKTDLLIAQYSQDISNLKMSLIALEDEKKEGLAEKDNIIMNCQREVEESKVKSNQLITELEAANGQMEKCEQEMLNALKEKEDECKSLSVLGETLRAELDKKDEQYNALKESMEKVENDSKAEIEVIRKESEHNIEELQHQVKKEQENVCRERESKKNVEGCLAERNLQVRSMAEEIASMNEKYEDNRRLVNEKEEILAMMNTNNELLRAELLAAKDDGDAAFEIKAQFDKIKSDLEESRQNFKAELQQQASNFNADLEKKREEITKLEEERQKLTTELVEGRNKVSSLEEKIHTEQEKVEEDARKVLEQLKGLTSVCGVDMSSDEDGMDVQVMKHIQGVSKYVSVKLEQIDYLKEKLKSKEDEYNTFKDAQLEKEESLQSSLELLKSEKVQLQQQSKEMETKIDVVEKELKKSKEDHEFTLQAVEEEMGKMKASHEDQERNVHHEKEQQVQEFKTLLECKENLIQDLRYRECEISNLLERTRNDSEVMVAEINSKMNNELSQMQEKMDELNTEVDMLRAQLESSKIAHEEAVREYQHHENEQVSLVKSQLENLDKNMQQEKETLEKELEVLRCSEREHLEKLESLKTAHSQQVESLLKEGANTAEAMKAKFDDLERESKAEVEELGKKLSRVCSERQSLSNEKEELKSNATKLEGKLGEQEKHLQTVQESNAELTGQVGTLEQQLRAAGEERDSLKRVLEQSDDVSDNMKKEVDILTEKIAHLERQLEKSNDSKACLESSLAELKKECGSLQEQLESANGLLEEKMSVIKQKNSAVITFEVEKNMLEEKWGQAEKELNALKIEFENVKEERETLQQVLNESKQKCIMLENAEESRQKQMQKEIDEIGSNKEELLRQVNQLEECREELQERIGEIEGCKKDLEKKVKDVEVERDDLKEKLVEAEADVEKRHEDVANKDLLTVKKQLKQKEEEVVELSDRLENEVETNKAWQTEVEGLQSRLDEKEKEMQSQNSEWKTKYTDLKKKAELKLTMIKKQLTAEKDKEISEAVKANNDQSAETQELEELRSENWHLHEKIEELEIALRSSETCTDQEKATEELEEKHYMKIKELAKNVEIQMSETEKKHQEELDEAINNAHEIASSHLMEIREDLKRSNEMLHDKTQALEDSYEIHQKELEARDLKLSELTKFYQAQLQATERNWKQLLDEQRHAMEKRHHEELDGLTEEWQRERLQMEQSNNATYVSGKERELGGGHSSSSSGESNGSENTNLEGLIELEYLRNILYQYMMGKEPLVLAKVLATVVRFNRGQTERVLQREEQKHGMLGVGLNRKS